jgi:hypothetical protein
VTDDSGRADAEMIHQRQQVAGKRFRSVATWCEIAEAVTAQIVGGHTVVTRQRRQHFDVPLRQAGRDAVHEDDIGSGALDLVVNGDAVDGRFRHVRAYSR